MVTLMNCCQAYHLNVHKQKDNIKIKHYLRYQQYFLVFIYVSIYFNMYKDW